MKFTKLLVLSTAFIFSAIVHADAVKFLKVEVDGGSLLHPSSFKANTDTQEGKDKIVHFFSESSRKREIFKRVLAFQNSPETTDKVKEAEGLLDKLISQTRYVKGNQEVLDKLKKDFGIKAFKIELRDDRLPLRDRIAIGFLGREGDDPSTASSTKNFMERDDLQDILGNVLQESRFRYEEAIMKVIEKEENRLYASSQEERDAQNDFINDVDLSGFGAVNNGTRSIDQDRDKLQRAPANPVNPQVISE